MRKLPLLLSAFLLALVAGAALAGPITLDTGDRFEFTNCSASGSAAQTVRATSYLMRVTDEDVFLCYAATCASGGEKFPAGTVVLLRFNAAQQLSCRSSGASGDIILTGGT